MLPIAARQYVRQTLIENLSDSKSSLFTNLQLQSEAILPIEEGQMYLPMKLTDYTDFYTSVVHAETVSIEWAISIASDTSCHRLIRKTGRQGNGCTHSTGLVGVSNGLQRSRILRTGIRHRCYSSQRILSL